MSYVPLSEPIVWAADATRDTAAMLSESAGDSPMERNDEETPRRCAGDRFTDDEP